MHISNTFLVTAIIAILVLCGAMLRLWNLDSLPQEIHRDEAAIGYNAYSLLHSGQDEYGQPWPINFRSFGDYKLPGLIYTTIPFIHFFDLHVWVLRLPTALYAIFTIPLTYFFARSLGLHRKTSLIATVLVTFSFWHISQARNVYEPMIGLFFSTLTITAWLNAQKKQAWYFLAIISYALGSLYYNLPWLYLPIALAALSLLYYGKGIVTKKAVLVSYAVVLAVFMMIGVSVFSTSATKSSVTLFNNPDLAQLASDSLYVSLVGGTPSRVARLLEQPYSFMVLTGIKGYLSAFNPAYIFSTGDGNAWHNLRSIHLGNSNPALALALLAGVVVIIRNFRKKTYQHVAALLLLSPLISATTIDSPITNRLLDFHMMILIISAIGIHTLIEHSKHFIGKISIILFLGLYLYFFILFATRYFYTYNLTLAPQWNPGVRSQITTIKQREDAYGLIFLSGWDINYIYPAVFLPFDSDRFSQTATRYFSGFDHVSSYERFIFHEFSFGAIDSALLYNHLRSYKPILIAVRGELSSLNQYKSQQQTAFDGSIEWTMYEIDLDTVKGKIKNRANTAEAEAQVSYIESCRTTCDPMILQPFISQ